MTAAGTVRPAKVVIIGAGVAGLQALATARRLGAVVEVSDIRPEVEEQVKSLGGHFIPLPEAADGAGGGGYAKEMSADFLRRQREILKQHLAAANAVITTAAVPGKPAPRLVDADMVAAMQPGAVIIDLAAERGGNCELTRADEEVDSGGVRILGPTNLAAGDAARRQHALRAQSAGPGQAPRGRGRNHHRRRRRDRRRHASDPRRRDPPAGVHRGGFAMMGALLVGIYVFVLAIFVGFEIITKIPPTLHTPLMSGANAISGITLVGSLAAATTGATTVSNILGLVAIVFATINVVGGFLVTNRMLAMFGGKKAKR